MFVGILQFELLVSGSTSLKEKRRVVRSLKDRLHRERQVSVAEVDALDHRSRAILGLAVAAPTAARAGDVLDSISNQLHALRDAELVSISREIIKGDALPVRAQSSDPAALLPETPFSQDDLNQAESFLSEPRP